MQNILETIIAKKKLEVADQKKLIPLEKLLSQERQRKHFSLKTALTKDESSGIIAEFKRKSPSKNWINEHAIATDIVPGYEKAGAAGSSILTDNYFFGGSVKDILVAGEQVTLPILRKEFIVDSYQIIEANKMGADAILLIAACLTPNEVEHFSQVAKEFDMDVLLEIHNQAELHHICDTVDLVGVNNRNLKTFKTSLQNSIDLSTQIPDRFVKISESGIADAKDIKLLKQYGFQGFLIGESFMKTDNPGLACESFIKTIQS